MAKAYGYDLQHKVMPAIDLVRLWQSHNPFRTIVTAYQVGIWGIDLSSDSKTITTGTVNGQLKLWDRQGKRLLTPGSRERRSTSVAFSPDDRIHCLGRQ